jgi:hypothetical protein
MHTFKLHTLKQKLWAIVAASFAIRVIVFFALPNTPSFLAPDEGTYAFLTKWIGQSNLASEFPAYGDGLYLSSRSVIVPANFLYRLGFDELEAVRLVSSTYGFCVLLLVVFIALKLYTRYVPVSARQVRNEKLIAVLILVFAFLPSHFVWSNLGLRESATEFWLITAFITFFIIFHYEKKVTILRLLTLAVSIVLAFSTRSQVAWVLGITFIGYLIFHLREKNTYIVIPTVLGAVVLGSSVALGNISVDVESIFDPLLRAGEIVDFKQEANQVDAASVIEPPSCPRFTESFEFSHAASFETYLCIGWRAPYMVLTFLFRPILGVEHTSISSLFAAFENLVWLAFFVIIIGLLIRKRTISFLGFLLPSLIFLFLYLIGASAYQGNMGTGFRHKSLILWAVLLLIFALAWSKPEDMGRNSRNNSQESAV